MVGNPFTATLPITIALESVLLPCALSRKRTVVPFFDGGVKLFPVLPATALPFTNQAKVLFTEADQMAGVAEMLPPIFVREIAGGVTTVNASAATWGVAKRVVTAKSARTDTSDETLRFIGFLLFLLFTRSFTACSTSSWCNP